jgi:hypothetical protein
MGTADLRFNHVVAVDVMYLQSKPVLHVVCESTHYQAAKFLKNMTADEAWRTFVACWCKTYLGPPDCLRIDQGSNFVAEKFMTSASAESIRVLEAPVEHPASMSHVERYHGPLRVAFARIRSELTASADEEILQFAVKCVNDTVGPEGLTPTLLVYGSMPRPARNIPAETQLQRARAIDKARRDVEAEHAKRKVSFALKYRGPVGRERLDLQSLPYGAKVSVHRKGVGWSGPLKFIYIEGDTVVVEDGHGRKLFRSAVVKKWTPPTPEEEPTHDAPSCDTEATGYDLVPALPQDSEEKNVPEILLAEFTQSRRAELDGLRKNNMFRIVKRSSVPAGMRIYGTKWVDTKKAVGDAVVPKSRLVAANYRDRGACDVPTRSPTVTKAAQRIVVSLAASLVCAGGSLYTRDISQAYTQSDTGLERQVFLEPPPEMELEDDEVLLSLKPLYGIPEAGLHWFLTYAQHHTETLGMTPSKADRCLFFRRDDEGDGVSITALQVDDNLGVGTAAFLVEEEAASRKFRCKPRTIVGVGETVQFNGTEISRLEGNVFLMKQPRKLRGLETATTQNQLTSVRAAMQYVATTTRPDLAAPCQLLASRVGVHADAASYKSMNGLVEIGADSADDGLRFVPLDLSSMRVVVFADASFANASDYKSQIGFVVCLADANNAANIVHYGSAKCRRVTRSVMAAELHGLVLGFDHAYVVQTIVSGIMGRDIALDAYIDSKTVFDTVTKLGPTLEKRLQIDAAALQESHLKGELRSIYWIPSSENCADPLTKERYQSDSALRRLMRSNQLEVSPTGWVHRTDTHEHAMRRDAHSRETESPSVDG